MRIFVIICLPALALLFALSGCERGGSRGGGRRGSFPVVEIETSAGTIRAELWPDKAPKTVENFLYYVDSGFYDGTVFHRCIRGFMIQGGGVTPDGREKPTVRPPVINEADSGLSNVTGTLAMARTDDPHSATTQFFINTVDNRRLDFEGRTDEQWGYCVFGEVLSGMDVVYAIEEAATVGDERKGQPARPVVIKSIRRVGGAGRSATQPAAQTGTGG